MIIIKLKNYYNMDTDDSDISNTSDNSDSDDNQFLDNVILESLKDLQPLPNTHHKEREDLKMAIKESIELEKEMKWIREIENRIGREKREELMKEQDREYEKSIRKDSGKEKEEEEEQLSEIPMSQEELRNRRLLYFERVFSEQAEKK